jgi:hypothetical protein
MKAVIAHRGAHRDIPENTITHDARGKVSNFALEELKSTDMGNRVPIHQLEQMV